MADLEEEAIKLIQEAIITTPQDDPDRAEQLSNLGVYLGQRYDRTGAIADLDEAINMTRLVINDTPWDHPDRSKWLSNLGFYLRNRYIHTGAVADLEEAIKVTQGAITASQPGHPDRAGWLSNLGVYLGQRYHRTGAIADVDEAIIVARQAVDATRHDHPDWACWLDNLGLRLGDKYSHAGVLDVLEGAINVSRQAVDAIPPDHPHRATMLSNLGLRLGEKYSRTGALAALEEAINVSRQAVDAIPPDHPDRAEWLSNLGVYLSQRYDRTGAKADLEEAINMTRLVINDTSSDHPARSKWLSNLGIHLRNRYIRTGAVPDLEEAIKVAQEAVTATPQDHPDLASRLNNLGNWLGDRYCRTGAIGDLEEAIKVTQEAITATPPDHPNRAGWLNNLGLHLHDRYDRTGAMVDLNEAITVIRQAINSTAPDNPGWTTMLNSLGTCLHHRYSRTGAIADLEEAITAGRQAIDATPPDHPKQSIWLNNLGARLGDMYSQTGAMPDLEEAISMTSEAINAAPPNHPDQAKWLNNLGARLSDRYARTGAVADLGEAKQCFMAALSESASIMSERITAGRYFLSFPGVLQDQQAYSIAKTTIDLIPLLMTRSLQNTDKRHLLSAAVGLSSDAAAIALHFKQDPAGAIQLLETGRGVIAGAFFEQSEVSALEKDHPEMARSFIRLRDQLDTSSSRTFLATAEQPTIAVGAEGHTIASETEGHQRQEAGLQLARLLETIRSQPNFERFLLPMSEADMTKATSYGPIVILNVSSHRCDALIIMQSGIRLLELPHLSQDAISDRVGDLQSFETLEWLWDDVVHPVLDSLGFTGRPSGSPWPHIWWIPTGKLTRFPLHAAGHHLRRNGETALDRVVSSYASSVKAIVHSRQRGAQALVAGEPHNVVVVAMQHTPKQQPLEFADDEVDAVLATCRSMGLQHIRPQPRKHGLSSALEACSIFHFAGHGGTHPTEPLHSQLLLEDWDQEPFTVESLLETDLVSKPSFLAYLSACGTGQILDETSVDESIHLASAFELAGFRHVIGTLWSVDDRLSVDMARVTYEFLRSEGVRDESVSGGLHYATMLLRDQWIDSEEDAGRGRPGLSGWARNGRVLVAERKQLLWVPYVHYGA
jgi:tetratricopeptide (TPR) repeat protein